MRTMNSSASAARNEMILLNIVRARYGHPLTFVSVSSVSGNQNLNGSFGLPIFTFGPNRTPTQKQFVFGNNSISMGGSAGMNILPLETKEFYQGLLQPLSLSAAQFFVSQGYPRQLLYYLFIDSVRIKGALKDTILWNDPTDPTFPHFQEFVHRASESGLTVETNEGKKKSKNAPEAHLCFDSGIASVPLTGLSPICGRNSGSTTRLMGLFGSRHAPAQIKLRSTYGIFRYLGKLTDPKLDQLVTLSSRQHVGGLILSADERLFPVQHGLAADCLTSVSYEGETICVPASGAEQGALILQLLTQLLALNVSVRDLPIIQSVRISE